MAGRVSVNNGVHCAWRESDCAYPKISRDGSSASIGTKPKRSYHRRDERRTDHSPPILPYQPRNDLRWSRRHTVCYRSRRRPVEDDCRSPPSAGTPCCYEAFSSSRVSSPSKIFCRPSCFGGCIVALLFAGSGETRWWFGRRCTIRRSIRSGSPCRPGGRSGRYRACGGASPRAVYAFRSPWHRRGSCLGAS